MASFALASVRLESLTSCRPRVRLIHCLGPPTAYCPLATTHVAIDWHPKGTSVVLVEDHASSPGVLDLRGGVASGFFSVGISSRRRFLQRSGGHGGARWDWRCANSPGGPGRCGKAGRPVIDAVGQIVRRVKAAATRGGLRDQATIAAWLEAGLDRVVVGTQTSGTHGSAGWRKFFRPAGARWPRRPRGDPGRLDVSSVQAMARWPSSTLASSGWGTTPHRHRTRRYARRPEPPGDRGTGRVGANGGDRLGRGGHARRPRAAGRWLPIAGSIVGCALYEGRFSLVEAVARAADPCKRDPAAARITTSLPGIDLSRERLNRIDLRINNLSRGESMP